jgi:hypothetical protein
MGNAEPAGPRERQPAGDTGQSARPSPPPLVPSATAEAAGAAVGRRANPVGEPAAGNPPVRFDERGVETGHGGLLGHRQTKGPATRKASPTPPRHSSTLPDRPGRRWFAGVQGRLAAC